MQTLRSKTVAAAITLTTMVPAFAYYQSGHDAGVDYARVEHVVPLTRISQTPVSREECWDQPVTYTRTPQYPPAHSYTPTIAGGIVGAIVGNQFGSGSGKDWATVAGATLGASMGRDYTTRRAYRAGTSYTTTEHHCRMVTDYREEELQDGYLVTYSYNGRQFETRMDHHPGDRIKVKIDIVPVQ